MNPGLIVYLAIVVGLGLRVRGFIRDLRAEQYRDMPDWETLPSHAEPPPTCPLCRRPLTRASDATAGGAVLGTSTNWLCPVHGSFIVREAAA